TADRTISSGTRLSAPRQAGPPCASRIMHRKSIRDPDMTLAYTVIFEVTGGSHRLPIALGNVRAIANKACWARQRNRLQRPTQVPLTRCCHDLKRVSFVQIGHISGGWNRRTMSGMSGADVACIDMPGGLTTISRAAGKMWLTHAVTGR